METSKLKVTMKTEGTTRMMSFTGNIDEDFVFTTLIDPAANSYKIDFNEIKVINSCGIREWIRFVDSLGPQVKLEYFNCPQIIIQQMNLVAGFLTPNAKVTSFYATYFCEENDEEKVVLLNSDDIKDMKAPVVTTEVDGQTVEMEFDGIPERYFKFLKR